MSLSVARLREQLNLPNDILALYHAAKAAEVAYHIDQGCGYDITFLGDEDREAIVADVVNSANESEKDEPLFVLSMRVFACYVSTNGGEAAFGLTAHSLSDWK